MRTHRGQTPESRRNQSSSLPHRPFEDAGALIIGSLILSFGVVLLGKVGAVTGGLAGLAFLLTYSTGWSFGIMFFLINLPFYVLSLLRMGWLFTLKTFLVVGLISVLADFHLTQFALSSIGTLYACLLAGVLMGIGFLVLFRHRASAGGMGIMALYLQERFGPSAGIVQLGFDALIVLASLFIGNSDVMLPSITGVVVLNLILAVNHRPGRYQA
ncbi:YitT family protein [Pseudarthrobacter raffinosi]|uniref:YitT family protein n=1 Tax=Pseudarthrobacter raffinosi TaxID=2953651 RepID=UPI00208DFC1B|nr:YitT family protein [Pseudarthrobacter sp. MDT3-9]MCO4252112.1 YitT family protein [Pseudarthrobacter sp. MDT3-9]